LFSIEIVPTWEHSLLEGGVWINPASLASRCLWEAELLLPDEIILKYLKCVAVIPSH